MTILATMRISREIVDERKRQDEKWGQQNPPDGTSERYYGQDCIDYREECNRRFAAGIGSWTDILLEEVYEALAETDHQKLRTELIQVAAVCAAWAEAIDRRNA